MLVLWRVLFAADSASREVIWAGGIDLRSFLGMGARPYGILNLVCFDKNASPPISSHGYYQVHLYDDCSSLCLSREASHSR